MDLDKWKLQGGSAPVLQLKTLKIKLLQIFLLPSLKWQSTTGAVALYQFSSQGTYFLMLKWKEFFSLKLFLQLGAAHFYWKEINKLSFCSLSCILTLPCAGHLQKLAKPDCLLSAIYLTFSYIWVRILYLRQLYRTDLKGDLQRKHQNLSEKGNFGNICEKGCFSAKLLTQDSLAFRHRDIPLQWVHLAYSRPTSTTIQYWRAQERFWMASYRVSITNAFYLLAGAVTQHWFWC